MSAEKLRALLAEATPGPYAVSRYRHGGGRVSDEATGRVLIADLYNEADRELWIAAVNALPALLDVLDAARDTHRIRHGGSVNEAARCTGPGCSRLRDALARADEARPR